VARETPPKVRPRTAMASCKILISQCPQFHACVQLRWQETSGFEGGRVRAQSYVVGTDLATGDIVHNNHIGGLGVD
jgi:hypothetical protein